MAEKTLPHLKVTQLDDVLSKFSVAKFYYVRFLMLMFYLYAVDLGSFTNFVFVIEPTGYRCADERFANNTCGALNNATDVCTEWIYDNPRSFIAEFDIACQEWKRTFVGTLHNLGYACGLLLTGPLSDRIGRKLTIVILGAMGAVFGTLRAFVTHFWLYVLLEFLQAAFGDPYSPAFILGIEMFSPQKRVLAQVLGNLGNSLGFGLFGLEAWLFPYWRHLLIAVFAPFTLIPLFAFVMDESPRWLLSKGRKDEAITVLENMAKKSGIKLDKDELENLVCEKNGSNAGVVELLRITFTSAILLKRFFLSIMWWAISTFVNHGLRIHSVSLPGNKYLNFALLMPADGIPKLMNIWILTKFRRKYPLIITFILSGVFCFIQPFVPSSIIWLSLLLFFFGKFMSTIFMNTTYLYTSELFPTYTRNSMHSLCSALGRIGSVLAPQTPLLIAYWHGLPSLVFGLCSLIAGLVTFTAPDTANNALPDNVKQAEALGLKDTNETASVNETENSRITSC